MKKLLTLILVLILSLCLAACGKESGKKPDKEEQKEQQKEEPKEQKQEQEQEEEKDTLFQKNAEEREKQIEDEYLAEEMRHVIEVLVFGEPEIYAALEESIPSGETGVELARIKENGLEYCSSLPELKKWVTEIYGDELAKFDKDVFKSDKYSAKEYLITFRENDDETDGYKYEVDGTWK